MIRTTLIMLLVVGLSSASKGCQEFGHCKNDGICNSVTNTCDCPPGFTGARCSIGVAKTVCSKDPCKNGGTCQLDVHTTEGYSCECEPGFEGHHCETDIDECSENHPCGAGECHNTIGGYSCTCPENLTGYHCDKKVDRCQLYESKNSTFCLNGGECLFDRCGCSPGWAGERCDRVVPLIHEMVEMGCSASLRQAQYCLERFGDGVCDHNCSSEACMFDGFDCPSPYTKDADQRLDVCSNASFCSKVYGDGICHEACAVAECGFDGFDCREDNIERKPDAELVGVTVYAPPHVTMANIHLLRSDIGVRLYSGLVNISHDQFGPLVFEDLTVWSNATDDHVNNILGRRIDSLFPATFSDAVSTTVFFDIDVNGCKAGNGTTRVGDGSGDVINCFQNIEIAAQFLRMHLSRNRVMVGEALQVRLVQTINREPSPYRRVMSFILPGVAILFLVALISIFVIIIERTRKRKNKEMFAPVWSIPNGGQFHPPTPPYDTDSLDLCEGTSMLYPNLKSKKDNTYTINIEERSPLLRAVCRSDIAEVRKLMSSMATGLEENVDSQGLNVLHHAVANNDVDMLRILLESDLFDITERNFLGQSPIVYASRVGHPQVDSFNNLLKVLSEKQNAFYSLDINEAKASRDCLKEPLSFDHDERWSLIDDLGRSVVHYSSLNNLPHLINLFAVHGADVNLIDDQGDSPMHLAAKNGNTEAVQALLECGARINVIDINGLTPYQLAVQCSQFAVLNVLSETMTMLPYSPVAYSTIKKAKKFNHAADRSASSFGSLATLNSTWDPSFYESSGTLHPDPVSRLNTLSDAAQSPVYDCASPDNSCSNTDTYCSEWDNTPYSQKRNTHTRGQVSILTPPSKLLASSDGLCSAARVPEISNGNSYSRAGIHTYYVPSAV